MFQSKVLKGSEIAILKQHFEVVKINSDFQIVFEDQIPPVAIVLLSGKISLKSKKRIEAVVEPGVLMGAYHILHGFPVDLGCEINAESEVVLIYKSELIKISESHFSNPMKLILSV